MRQGATISRKLKVSLVEGRIIKDDEIIEKSYIIRGWVDPLQAERFIRHYYNVSFIADMTTFKEHTYMMDLQKFIDDADTVDGINANQLNLIKENKND